MNETITPTRTDPTRVLVVDDEADIRELVEMTLSRMGLASEAASSLESARRQIEAHEFDLCLTDMRLPDGDGLDLVADLAAQTQAPPIAVLTAYGDVDTAVNTLKAGAFDFVTKPVKAPQLRDLVNQALQLETAGQAQPATSTTERSRKLIGDSKPMRQLRKRLTKVRRSQAPIHIRGESGTGKELVARAIHAESNRSNGPFVPVNCGAIPAELIESELFGYVAGAFTGATRDTDGLFTRASGGTLFLDEVAELDAATQVKLLRALQERAIRPVGATSEQSVDLRVISATQNDLGTEIGSGRFRQDLYYRLNVIELEVPPLRQRRDDLPRLIDAVLTRLAEKQAAPQGYRITLEAIEHLAAHDFPGNVRELENILERAVALADDSTITFDDLALTTAEPAPATPGASNPDDPADSENAPQAELHDEHTPTTPHPPVDNPHLSLADELEALERYRIEEALVACRYNKTRAAKQLGLSFRALRYRVAKLDME